jgi:carbamoylphosphate synthase small subunit
MRCRYGIDTRALTKKLRVHGSMKGKIVMDEDVPLLDPNLVNQVSSSKTSSKASKARSKATSKAMSDEEKTYRSWNPNLVALIEPS